MAIDKKLSELPVLSNIMASDSSVVIHNSIDYQFSFATLLEFISASVNTGAAISFGSLLPQNTSGKNGDLFINIANNSFAQKVSGIWLVKYTLPSSDETKDGSVIYGSGTPGTGIGIDNDTYTDIDTGIFYHKTTDTWSQVFSMQSGPQGPQGDKGETGAAGEPGKSILHGTSNPSNLLVGVDGDFYINTNTYTFFGPKTDGVWGIGTTIVINGPGYKQSYPVVIEPDGRFVYDELNFKLTFNLPIEDQNTFPYNVASGILDAQLRIQVDGDGFVFKTLKSYDALITTDGSKYISVMFEGVTDITNLYLILS